MPNEQKSKSLQLRLSERALDEIGSAEPLNDVLVITLAGDAIEIERFRCLANLDNEPTTGPGWRQVMEHRQQFTIIRAARRRSGALR
jgi:hypothetical protein